MIGKLRIFLINNNLFLNVIRTNVNMCIKLLKVALLLFFIHSIVVILDEILRL